RAQDRVGHARGAHRRRARLPHHRDDRPAAGGRDPGLRGLRARERRAGGRGGMKLRNPIASKVVSWMCGLVAVRLSVVPFYAYTKYDGTGRILALEVVRHFQGPSTGSISSADAARYRVRHLGYRNGLAVLAFGGVMDGDTADGPTPESTTLPV